MGHSRTPCHEMVEHVLPLLDEVGVEVSRSLLFWNRRNEETWPVLDKFYSQLVELVVSSLNVERSVLVVTYNVVDDVVLGESSCFFSLRILDAYTYSGLLVLDCRVVVLQILLLFVVAFVINVQIGCLLFDLLLFLSALLGL